LVSSGKPREAATTRNLFIHQGRPADLLAILELLSADKWVQIAFATVLVCLLLAIVLHWRRKRKEEGFFEPVELL